MDVVILSPLSQGVFHLHYLMVSPPVLAYYDNYALHLFVETCGHWRPPWSHRVLYIEVCLHWNSVTLQSCVTLSVTCN